MSFKQCQTISNDVKLFNQRAGNSVGLAVTEDDDLVRILHPKITNQLKKVRFSAFFCTNIWSIQKKAVLLHSQSR